MVSHVLSVAIAFVAYSILDVSKAVQKIAIEHAGVRRLFRVAIWIAATLSTTVSALLLLYALSLGSVVIIGALGGTGMASLALFSVLVLKERVTRRQVAGIIAILAGPVAMASASRADTQALSVVWLYWFIGGVVVLYLIALALLQRRRTILGPLIGGLSGALSGIVLLLQKVSTTEHGRSVAWISRVESAVTVPVVTRVLEVLANPYAIAWIGASVLSTVVLQFAYKHDLAIRIVPVFAANTILIPILGGVLCFHDALHPTQWVGILLIGIGVSLLTWRRDPVRRTGRLYRNEAPGERG